MKGEFVLWLSIDVLSVLKDVRFLLLGNLAQYQASPVRPTVDIRIPGMHAIYSQSSDSS